MPRSYTGKRRFLEDYNNVAHPVLIPSATPLRGMCVTTEALEGLTHSPHTRCSYRRQTGLVWGDSAAARGQAASRSIPGAESFGSHGRARSGLRCHPTAVLSGFSGAGSRDHRTEGCLDLGSSSSGPGGCPETAAGEPQRLQHGHPRLCHEPGGAPLAQGQSTMEGTPRTAPAKLIRAHLLAPLGKRVSSLLPCCSMGFLSQGLPAFASLLAQPELWHLPPPHEEPGEEEGWGTGRHSSGAGGGQPEPCPA